MNVKEKLSQSVGNPLEWSASAKAALLLWTYLFDQFFYLAFVWLGQHLDALKPWTNQEQMAIHGAYFFGLTLCTAAMLLLVRFTPKRYQEHVLFEYVSCLYFGLTHVYYGYCVGLSSVPVGVVLVGAPVVGFILLNRKAVACAFISSLLLIIGLNWASVSGVIPYAPFVRNLMASNGQMETVWVVSYWLLALPHILFIFSLAYFVLQRWRIREQEVTLLSRTDGLTGLVNRRHILHLLHVEKMKCEAGKLPLSIVMVDLDHFKRINDQWGHDVGDRALQAAADALRVAIRQHDHVGRYGGEEFLVLLPGLDSDQARLLAERIRAAIAAVQLKLVTGQSLSLSASLGMSSATQEKAVSVDELIKQADLALYRAKDTGRDRLVVAAA